MTNEVEGYWGVGDSDVQEMRELTSQGLGLEKFMFRNYAVRLLGR